MLVMIDRYRLAVPDYATLMHDIGRMAMFVLKHDEQLNDVARRQQCGQLRFAFIFGGHGVALYGRRKLRFKLKLEPNKHGRRGTQLSRSRCDKGAARSSAVVMTVAHMWAGVCNAMILCLDI